MNRLHSCLLAVLLLLTLPAYGLAQETYVDGTGAKVLAGRNAQRIVSLAPAATELLFYLGFGDAMVGRSSYCNYPAEALKLPSVGGFTDTSLEKIVALKPDLVVAYQGNNLELVSQLRQLKITVLALNEAKSFADIQEEMLALLLVAGDGDTYSKTPPRSKIVEWGARLMKLSRDSAPDKPTVFYGMPGEVTYTAAPGSFIDDLIKRAGGRNVVPKGKDRWPQVGAEFILAAQPDWLLISTPCTGHTELSKATRDIRSSLTKDPVWSKLKAVQQNHIVVINADVLLRPGPRLLDALEQLATALHGGGK